MADLITFLDNNRKLAVYTRVNIHGIYCYIEIIGSQTTFTTSCQRYHHFGPSSSTKNYTSTLQPVIVDLRIRQKNVFKCCGIIIHKSDTCIIHGPIFLPPSLRIKMNQFNTRNVYETTDPPRYWNSQPKASHFKYRTFPPKTSPVVPDIMGWFNHHTIDNDDFEVHPSEFPIEYNSEYVPDPDTTPIKTIYGDEMDHLLVFFHS